jgi:hypothetical protein
MTTAGPLSFNSRLNSADAAVEAQVRIIRQQLGLPPPENSQPTPAVRGL